jgi:hypothetical protein
VTRAPPPTRRPSITEKIYVTIDNAEHTLLITIGYRDRGTKIPFEVFCASFKVGTALNSIVSDSCILLSRLMQHGDAPAELAAALCTPPSLIGTIAAAVAAAHGRVHT